MSASPSNRPARRGPVACSPSLDPEPDPRVVTLRVARRRPLVVFIGVEDDVRSRLAAGLVSVRAQGIVESLSVSDVVGEPGPLVRRVVAELGVSFDRVRSAPITQELLQAADRLIAIGYDCQSLLPDGRTFQDWCIDDPRDKDEQTVRYIRDAIDRRVRRMLGELRLPPPELAAVHTRRVVRIASTPAAS